MKFENRASFGWPVCKAATAHPLLGMVAHYNGPPTGLAVGKPHSACVSYWQSTRKYHMGTQGWADIGYSFGVCPHGTVMEGRGLGRVQAAQPGGNSTYYSCTFMIGDSELPGQDHLSGWHDLRDWLLTRGVSGTVRPHSAFISTDCPGPAIQKLITTGILTERRPVSTFSDVWKTDGITAPPWQVEKGNPTWQAASYLYESYLRLTEIKNLLEKIDAKLPEPLPGD